MSLETLHLVLFLWMGVCLMALVASFVCAFPRAVRASHAPVSVEVRTPGSRRIPQGVVPAPTRPAPDIKVGLRKSRVALVGRLERLLRGREQLDEETFAEIESILFPRGISDVSEQRDVEIVFNAKKYECILVTADGGSGSQRRGILGSREELEALGIEVMADHEAVERVRKGIERRDKRARAEARRAGVPLPSWVGND